MLTYPQTQPDCFTPVYGPVHSWRLGRSLGIDPIGPISSCSFDCAYCQLGQILFHSPQRQLWIPTQQILQALQQFPLDCADVITLSGSGEPTLALNLREILEGIADLTDLPKAVLTNGSLLWRPEVRDALEPAQIVAVKLDGITSDQVRRVNRPATGIELPRILAGIAQFRHDYSGRLAIQTMLLAPWSLEAQQEYIRVIRRLQPDEIQLNLPTRPRPLQFQHSARGDHRPDREYPTQSLKVMDPQSLREFADRIREGLQIPVRYPAYEVSSTGVISS